MGSRLGGGGGGGGGTAYGKINNTLPALIFRKKYLLFIYKEVPSRFYFGACESKRRHQGLKVIKRP